MAKDVNGRFDDYSISPKIRQTLLHWGYELVENDFLWFIFSSLTALWPKYFFSSLTNLWPKYFFCWYKNELLLF